MKNIPPGWSYNPASWTQRAPIIILAFIGFGIATYLSLYQLEIIDSVWEPFFGDGSVKILNSFISHILPVPDAALGAFSYVLDAIYRLIVWITLSTLCYCKSVTNLFYLQVVFIWGGFEWLRVYFVSPSSNIN